MKTPHTPTPWRVACDAAREATVPIFGADLRYVGSTGHDRVGLADAAVIVRAVNSHDRLVKALRALVGNGNNRWGYDVAANALNDDIRNEARAALAEAEGEYR